MTQVVQARCPHCQNVLRIPQEWLTQPMRCKHCKNTFQAKSRSSASAEVGVHERADRGARPRRDGQRTSSRRTACQRVSVRSAASAYRSTIRQLRARRTRTDRRPRRTAEKAEEGPKACPCCSRYSSLLFAIEAGTAAFVVYKLVLTNGRTPSNPIVKNGDGKTDGAPIVSDGIKEGMASTDKIAAARRLTWARRRTMPRTRKRTPFRRGRMIFEEGPRQERRHQEGPDLHQRSVPAPVRCSSASTTT